MSKDLTPENAATSGSTMSGALGGTPKPEDEEEKVTSLDTPQMSGSTAPATIGGGGTSTSVKAMPKQQKAGTGTFANLKSYLQAAQGGGRVAQAATQRVQNVAGQAQQGIGKAQEAFRTRMQTGSGAAFRGTEPDKYLTEAQAAEQARARTESVLGTARGVTYQAPQKAEAAPETQQAQIPAPAQPQAPAQQYFTPEQQQQFADIINAQYEGPESLQQAGLYEQAARKAQTAQQALQQAQTAGGREQLLRDIFGRTRDYSRGQSKLDALLLNTSQQGIQSLQEQAQKAGNVQQQLQEAQNLSANEAARRAEAIQGIASGARTAFTTARTAEEEATNKRITDLIETPAVDASGNKIPKTDSKGDPILDSAGNVVYQTEWDRLPEYFRNVLREAPKGQVKLSPEEMAILGVGAGEGLYNLGENLIGNVAAERERLITKDELSRQLALQQLAGLDVSKELQKDLLYKDLEKAGTQTLGSSLNVEGIREALKGAQEGFKTAAEQATLTGTGSKKVSRGNVFGKKTKTYTAEESGNVAEMLRQGGYDISKMEPEQVKSLLTDRDLLNRYLGATSTSRDTESNIGGSALEGTGAGASVGAGIGAIPGGPVGAGIGAVIGGAAGGMVGANTIDQIQYYTDIAKELEDKLGIKGLGAVGQGVQDVRSGVGGVFTGAGNIAGSSVVGDVFRGVGGAIGGINTGEMKSVGEKVSKRLAQEDLANKYKEWLQGQGFENRLVASQDPEVLARSAALQNLLRRQG